MSRTKKLKGCFMRFLLALLTEVTSKQGDQGISIWERNSILVNFQDNNRHRPPTLASKERHYFHRVSFCSTEDNKPRLRERYPEPGAPQ
jgi:hypothetical protein